MSDFRIDTSGLSGDGRIDVSDVTAKAREMTSFRGLTVSPDEYDLITRAVADAPDQEEEFWKIANAYQHARMNNRPLWETIENLDSYNNAFLGAKPPPKTAVRAITDSFTLADLSAKTNNVGIQIMSDGGENPELFAEYQALMAEIEKYQDNVENRNLGVEMLKAGAQNYHNIIRSAAVVGIGAALAPFTGGASAASVAAMFKYGTGALSARDVLGNEYLRLRSNGAEHGISAALATLSAGIQGGIEVALGADRVLVGLFTKGEVKGITSAIAKKMLFKDVTGTVLARAGARFAGTVFEETVEEAAQELVSKAADFTASEIMERKGVSMNRQTFMEAMGDVVESAKMGALAAPLFGLINAPRGMKFDYDSLVDLKNLAKTSSRRNYKAAAKENPAGKEILSAIPEAEQDAILDKAWVDGQKEAAREAESADSMEPDRLPNGTISTQNKVLASREDGSVDSVMKAGSSKTGDLYGYVRYELRNASDGTKEAVIREADFNKGYEGVAPEVMVKLAAQMPGVRMVSDEDSSTSARSLVERMSLANPRGPEHGAQYFQGETDDEDAMAKAELRAQIAVSSPNTDAAQAEVTLAMIEMAANAKGKGFAEFRRANFQDTAFRNDDKYVQEWYNSLNETGTGKVGNALVEFDNLGKAVIVLGKGANFRTLTHESLHVIRRSLTGTENGKALESHYGVSGSWTVAQDEALVDDALTFLAEKKVPDERLRGLFEQIAVWLNKLWQVMKERSVLSPELEKIIGSLFSSVKLSTATMEGQGSTQASMVEADAIEGPQTGVMGPYDDGESFQEGNPFDEMEQEAQPEAQQERQPVEDDPGRGPSMPTTSLDREKNPVTEFPVAGIRVQQDIRNFKQGANKRGVVSPLKASRYIRLGTAPIVVWQRTTDKEGEGEVITGRHKLDLATRTGEQTIPAQVVREADGFTKEWAEAFDAEANIRDGQGSVADYANYFHNSPNVGVEQATEMGLLSRQPGRDGFAIGKYAGNSLLALFRDGRISDRKAAAISDAARNNEGVQAIGIRKFRDMTAEELFGFVSIIAAESNGGNWTETDMFGRDDPSFVEAEAVSKEAGRVIDSLVAERRALESGRRMSKTDRMDVLGKYGFKSGDTDAIDARLEELWGQIEGWKGWATDREKVRELRRRLGFHVQEEVVTEQAESEQDSDTISLFETDSPEFREWFGDSKVVDAEGKPLVVYHGTKHAFDRFDLERAGSGTDFGWLGRGIYTTTSKKVANAYASWPEDAPLNVMPLLASIKNPYYYGSKGSGLEGELYGDRTLPSEIRNAVLDEAGFEYEHGVDYGRETKEKLAQAMTTVLERMGHDGLIADFMGEKEIVAFFPTQIKSVNNRGTWSKDNPRMLFEDGEGKTLAVLHNINADTILSVETFGGMPSPSLAITKPDIPFEQFGDTTLIADPMVATRAMVDGRLMDRDIWSPTVPDPEWKLDTKKLGAFDQKIRGASRKITASTYGTGLNSLNESYITGGPAGLVSYMAHEDYAKAAFLDEKGIGYTVEMREESNILQIPVPIVAAVKSILPADYVAGSDVPSSIIDRIGESVAEYYEDTKSESLIRKFQKKYTGGKYPSKIAEFALSYQQGKQEADTYKTQDNIDAALSGHEDEFMAWLNGNITPAYSNPTIKIAGKKVPFNAGSVLEWMRTKYVRGSQETMTYGPSKAASMAGRPLMNRSDVADNESKLVTTEEAREYYARNAEPIINELNDKLPGYSMDSTWDAIDGIYKSIGKYLQAGTVSRSPERMKKTLSASGFTNVPKDLVSKAVDLAHILADKKEDYFEAKPDTILTFNDFRAAVIPAGAPEAAKAKLREYGIRLHEYTDDRQARMAEALAEPDILFEPDLFSESVLNDEVSAYFGTTDNPREAGYVLSDGRMLDFSGRGLLDKGTTARVPGGMRMLAHEAISKGGTFGRDAVVGFLKKSGAVRADFGIGSFYSIGTPSMDAERTIAEHATGQITIHMDSSDGMVAGRKTLVASPEAIRQFYSSPTKPENLTLFEDWVEREMLSNAMTVGNVPIMSAMFGGEAEVLGRQIFDDKDVRITDILFEDEPLLIEGMTRLYRGETDVPATSLPPWLADDPRVRASVAATGRWFTASRDEALWYSDKFGSPGGRVSYVDVPSEDVEGYLASGQEAGSFSAPGMAEREFFLPKDIADSRNPLFEDIAYSSSLVMDALEARNIPYFMEGSTSSGTRYFRLDVNGNRYRVRVSDHKAPKGSERNTWNDYMFDTVDGFDAWLDGLSSGSYPGSRAELPPGGRSAEVLFAEDFIPSTEQYIENRGRLAEKLSQNGELERFLSSLWARIKDDYDPAKKAKGDRSDIGKRLASHPFISGAAQAVGKDGKELDYRVRRVVIGSIRNNELPVKELYAEVMGDPDMALEARDERASVVGPTDIKNPYLGGYDRMDLAERQALLDRVRDQKVRERIVSGEITDKEISYYIDRLMNDRSKLARTSKTLENQKERNRALWDALKSAREESVLLGNEIRAMYRLREARESLKRAILRPPAKNIMYEQKQVVRYIQEYLKAKRWETERTENGGFRRTGRIIEPTGLAIEMSQLFRDSPDLSKVLGENVVSMINEKPYGDWSISELQELLDIINGIKDVGRSNYAARDFERRKVNMLAQASINSALRKAKGYKQPLAHGSEDEAEQVKKLNAKNLVSMADMNMARFSEYVLDKGSKVKTNRTILVDEEREHFREKMLNVERRVNPVKEYMQKHGMKVEDLYKRKITIKGVGPTGTDAEFTAWDLLMAHLALRNERSAAAFLAGNLFDENERAMYSNEELQRMSIPKQAAVERAVASELTKEMRDIGELIARDFDREFDRLNKAVIELTNEDMPKERNYVPIVRQGATYESFGDEIINDLAARKGISLRAGPKNGWSKSRVDIGWKNQTPMKLDLWSSFTTATDKQEHLVAYGEYHRKLLSIYSNQYEGAKLTRENIKHLAGKVGLDYLDRYITEVANPVEYKDMGAADTLIGKFRGKVSIGYLAYRWSSVAIQLITSPLPFLAYAPGNLFGAAMQMAMNPMGLVAKVEEMSVMMRHRRVDEMYEHIAKMSGEGLSGIVNKIGQFGMGGLSFADRYTVALGWKAVYDSEMSKHGDHDRAVLRADDVTLKCQPSARGVDMSPLFRDNSNTLKMITQFGSQLNVVWQQLRYDMPEAAAEKRFGEFVGIIVGTSLAGIGLGALRGLRGKDEPEEEWWRTWIYYSVSQGFDSMPFIGSTVSATMKRIITGDKRKWSNNSLLPVVEKLLTGSEGLVSGRGAALANLAEGVGLATGLPVLALEEYFGWMLDILEER